MSFTLTNFNYLFSVASNWLYTILIHYLYTSDNQNSKHYKHPFHGISLFGKVDVE